MYLILQIHSRENPARQDSARQARAFQHHSY